MLTIFDVYTMNENYRTFPKTTDFENSNYRLFEENLAVPDTSNNRGLTVPSFSI